MRKLIIIVLVSLLTAPASFGQKSGLDAIWEQANDAYLNGDYAAAIGAYNTILADGYSSYKLYYNLGNSYFKEGNIGKAILFYNRALLLKPSDADAKFNLEIAESHVRLKIEPIPEFFLTSWIRSFRSMLSTNGWAVFSLIFLAVTLGSVMLYLLSEKLSLRKTGFYTAIVAIIFFIVSLGFSIVERNEILNSSDAIVMSSAVTVKSSPDDASKDVFILYEGTKVKIVSTLGQWAEIEIADGNKGWITANAIETIR